MMPGFDPIAAGNHWAQVREQWWLAAWATRLSPVGARPMDSGLELAPASPKAEAVAGEIDSQMAERSRAFHRAHPDIVFARGIPVDRGDRYTVIHTYY